VLWNPGTSAIPHGNWCVKSNSSLFQHNLGPLGATLPTGLPVQRVIKGRRIQDLLTGSARVRPVRISLQFRGFGSSRASDSSLHRREHPNVVAVKSSEIGQNRALVGASECGGQIEKYEQYDMLNNPERLDFSD
jgi:hypothetical protein